MAAFETDLELHPDDAERIIADLRVTASTMSDRGSRAALLLIIEHESWLWRPDFVDTCVITEEGTGRRFILWYKAKDAMNAGAFSASSSSEMAILEIALSLTSTGHPVDLYRTLCLLDDANRRLVAGMVSIAVGM